MAKKMVLVPADSVATTPQTHGLPMTNLLEMLPKGYQSRGKIILLSIDGKVTLDQQHRVVYANGDVGSHVIDLIRFFVTPRNVQTKRPWDATVFATVMRGCGVPEYLLSRLEPTKQWLSLQYNSTDHIS
jgi:hypothetical protein